MSLFFVQYSESTADIVPHVVEALNAGDGCRMFEHAALPESYKPITSLSEYLLTVVSQPRARPNNLWTTFSRYQFWTLTPTMKMLRFTSYLHSGDHHYLSHARSSRPLRLTT